MRRDAHSMEFVATSPKFRVVDETTGCWNWALSTNRWGYGQVGCMGKKMSAHRLFYEFYRGRVSGGLQLDHLCRNRRCVNPAHLEAVPQRVNILRGVGGPAVNFAKTACAHGHPFDERNTHVTQSGTRRCRVCNKLRARRLRAAARLRAYGVDYDATGAP